jgi:hypothetical protein
MVTVKDKVLLPKRTMLVTVVMLSIVLAIWLSNFNNTSPGQISAVHAQDSVLTEADCQRCHGQSVKEMAKACLDCHEDISQQMKNHRGMHGQLSNTEQDCARCHSEHHGRDFQLTNSRSFRLIGVGDKDKFDHKGLDFHLHGAHAKTDCQSCHKNAAVKLLLKGQKRFLGESQDCNSCHDDVHMGEFGEDCQKCHDQAADFQASSNFNHHSIFPLTGSHKATGCLACHKSDSAYAVSKLAANIDQRQTIERRDCLGCHESVHSEGFLLSMSHQLQISAEQSCAKCHDSSHEGFSGPQASIAKAAHAATGFKLDKPHDQIDCQSCHRAYGQAKTKERFSASFPGRQAKDCQACHTDPHRGQFDKGPLKGSSCLDCHDEHSFEEQSFTAKDHHRTDFSLSPAHKKVACESCHDKVEKFTDKKGKNIASRVFHGTPKDCRSCHTDPHRGQFDKGAFAGSCLNCHQEHSFKKHSFTAARHENTEFPLSKAHKEVRCQKCHSKTDQIQTKSKELIVTHIFKGTPKDCRSCHADPHFGQFAGGRFGDSCLSCHDEHRFQPTSFTLTTHDKTGFPLTGAHDAVGCNNCHSKFSIHKKDGKKYKARIFHGTSKKCVDCHEDAHLGVFKGRGHLQIEGRESCERCHSTERFDKPRQASFDHKLWTGFTLDGAHEKAKCGVCHSAQAPDRLGRTFAAAAGKKCQSCHQDPHVGQFGATERVDCQSCHTVTDFKALIFDHQTQSRFVLDNDHKNNQCSACHKPQELADGRRAVRYKPLGIKCGDCHIPGRKKN